MRDSCYRSEFDGDLQSQLLSKANEEDKNCSRALSVVSTVVRAAKDLLHRALAVDADDIPELLSSSSLFSMLLPLIIAYIGPVAAAIPKVAVEVFGLVQQLLPSVAILRAPQLGQVLWASQSCLTHLLWSLLLAHIALEGAGSVPERQ